MGRHDKTVCPLIPFLALNKKEGMSVYLDMPSFFVLMHQNFSRQSRPNWMGLPRCPI